MARGQMAIFSPSDLGKWEREYRLLVEGERHSLSPDGTWLLGDKPGLVAIFDGDEVVFIGAARTLAKTLQLFHKEGAVNEFRTGVAIFECGFSPKNVEQRYKDGRNAKRVDSVVARMSFSVAPAPTQHLDLLAEAFIAVADPRFNGPTARANLAIDSLPQEGKVSRKGAAIVKNPDAPEDQ